MKKTYLIPLLFVAAITAGFFYRKGQVSSEISELRRWDAAGTREQKEKDSLDKLKNSSVLPFPYLKHNPYKEDTPEHLNWEADSIRYYYNNKFPNRERNLYEIGTVEYKQWKRDSAEYVKNNRN